jgi:acyl-CoA synthetase (AMP-forming)/AMP-acid ligase II
MFIVGGFNVAPAEVEKALTGMAGIAQVAVVGVPDDYFGEVGAAFVIPAPGVQLTPDDVHAYAREHLANFKVPRRVIFVDEFPVNATGKVLKNELRARAQALLQT